MRIRRVVVTDWAETMLTLLKRDLHAGILEVAPKDTVVLGQRLNRRTGFQDVIIQNQAFEDVPIGEEPPVHPLKFKE